MSQALSGTTETVSLNFSPELAAAIREQARRHGLTLEDYLHHLLAEWRFQEATPDASPSGPQAFVPPGGEGAGEKNEDHPKYISDPRPTPVELDQLLGRLAAVPRVSVLPADFSRADIYDDPD